MQCPVVYIRWTRSAFGAAEANIDRVTVRVAFFVGEVLARRDRLLNTFGIPLRVFQNEI